MFLNLTFCYVYLLPDASRTPSGFHFASRRSSWRTSGTLLGCCQASPKCLSVLLGRFSAALGSLLHLSCSLLNSSCLPDSPSVVSFRFGERFWSDLTTTTQAQNLNILKHSIDPPFCEGNLPNPKLLGRCSLISLSLSSLSLVCHLSALFSTPEETKQLRHKETKPTKPAKLHYIIGYWSGGMRGAVE